MAGEIKQRMIDSTALLLAKRGLQGTSFSEIIEASGAPRGSLYHHFPGGKDELVLAAVGAAGERAMAVLEQLSGRSAVDVATAFLALWRSVLTRSEFSAGCAVAAVTVAADSNELLDRAGGVFRGWRHSLSDLLTAGGVDERRAQALAASLIAAGEGAVVLSRAERSLEPFDLVANEQLAVIEAASGGHPRHHDDPTRSDPA
ncbi:MAG: TetR/AcrR family transcriptional regulator [Herbiconiux sp.]|uniref:TetR/AcrR family transcriptional regulator n=1 Tax=Herbiconiux sp. TaxID=1871186 RepID=UPI0011F81D62|nr:TetR/AcrR family transcriptional regulator [Herbiconiux sp.]TAJ46087.1 MAG: TetR/AcrR family transcriptional regulator [Herbiconiux sp.]